MHRIITEVLSQYTSRPVQSIHTVSGGDINDAHKVVTSEGTYFIKTNARLQEPARMFAEEARALTLIGKTNTARVPKVLLHGSQNDVGYLILEWIEPGSANIKTDQMLGASLALLHKVTAESYGWDTDNFIGTLDQRNSKSTTWSDFYINQRLLPQFELACRAGYLEGGKTQNFMKSAEALLVSEKPALLHGDLWSGNWMCDREGDPYLIDPAIYFGDREVDIAMTHLFGGFAPAFYSAYNDVYSLSPDYEDRIPIYQLYYLLVHLNLFGTSYRPGVLSIMNRFGA